VDGKLHPELLPSKRIFPNPAGNYVDLVYPFGKVKNVQLIDINGRLIDRSAKIQEINFITRISFTKSMPSGIYFLKVESESGTFVEKLIKE